MTKCATKLKVEIVTKYLNSVASMIGLTGKFMLHQC